MSKHNVQDVAINLVPGDGQHTVVLTITAPGLDVQIEGTPQQLRNRVVEGLMLPVPDDVPLVDNGATDGFLL